MANICENTITVIGLKEAPELFLKSLSKAMFQIDLDNLDPKQWGEDPSIDGKTWYRSLVEQHRQTGFYPLTYCILYPHKPYNRLGVTAPRFHVDTKWGSPTDMLIEASKVFPTLLFDLSWWVEQDGPIGESVIKNGEVVKAMRRSASRYLFDSLVYPTAGLLPAHLSYTLAQRGTLRIKDAVDIIQDLRNILDDDRFRSSQSRPFSECRDKKKTQKLQAGLATLHESMVEQAKQLGFDGVFLEEQELTERYPAVVEADSALMKSLGLEPMLPAPDATVRFSMLRFQVALAEDPNRVVSPVLHYTNADPASGKYQKNPDGSIPAIEWEIKYACLTPSEVRQIRRLPDEGQTPFDVDLIMTNASDRGFGHEIYRASNRAMWTRNPEFRSQVEMEAIKVTNAFAAKVAGKPGIAILDNFEAADATLFPKTIK